MARLIARDQYLWADERKFYARGVSYGPFTPNSRGERYPEPERAAADFALMRELGVNVLRVYVPPPAWMFELALRHELRLMVGMPWPFHMMFLDSPAMSRDIRQTITRSVGEMRQFRDAIFAWSLGNEIRSDVVRWHGPKKVSRFLAELYDAGKNLDPDGLFTYSNYPSVEYLDLSFLDLVCFNVYLHREADYRRYLTHLMALAGPRPLVLSETGMDTIREGEAHQAQLLTWQARAAFELGLSGFIVFAFTDEWHTGGAEISDWAFGLVTRERRPKQAFGALREVFTRPLPPPPVAAPKVSVVVAAYNAERTLDACLDSLRRLSYPSYEVIVVDDGSTDGTAAIARAAEVKLLSEPHRGLAAARNRGVAAATGDTIAFIDADATADPDWLYHLTAALSWSGAAAAGGPNFAPPVKDSLSAAIAAAPGQPREVKASEDCLAQLCGCNMAISRSALERLSTAEPSSDLGSESWFDSIFTAAGDDVDFSWRVCDSGGLIAYAPGAVVVHERRPTIGAYLVQQMGYGRGEAVLARKYPKRPGNGIYGAPSWQARWLGRGRIYYGVMGRGLFQSIYPAPGEPGLFNFARGAGFMLAALALLVGGWFVPGLWLVGLAMVLFILAGALVSAAQAPLPRGCDGWRVRGSLALLALAGPLARSYARLRAAWTAQIRPTVPSGPPSWRVQGMVEVSAGGGQKVRSCFISALRQALFRRGLAVAPQHGFDPFDLQMILGPVLRIPLLVSAAEGPGIRLRWRLRLNFVPLVILLLAVMLLAFAGYGGLAAGLGLAVLGWWGLLTIPWLRRLSGVLSLAAAEAGQGSVRTLP